MESFVQVAIFIGLSTLVAWLTFRKCRGQTGRADTTSDEQFLASRKLSWWFVAGSITLTTLSTDQLVGMNGAQVLLICWWEFAAVVGLLILAHVFLPIYYRNGCSTVNELLEQRYQSRGVRAAVSLLLLVTLPLVSMPVLLYTSSLFFQSVFVPGFPILWIATIFAVIAALYAILGGMRGIAVSGTYYGVGILGMGLWTVWRCFQAIDFDLSGIPPERLTLIGDHESLIPWHTLLTGMVFIQIYFWCANQYVTQRALASWSIREARKGIYAAALFRATLLPLMVALPGVIGYKLYGDVGDTVYGRLVSDLMPAWLSGAFAAVIAGIVLSTLNANLNIAASLYICDFHQRYLNPQPNTMRLTILVTALCILTSLVLVPVYSRASSIIDVLQQLHGIYSMPILAVFLSAILLRGIAPQAVIGSLVFGSALYCFFTFVWTPLHYIHLMFITLIACMALMIVVSRCFYGNRIRVISRRESSRSTH